MGFEASKYDYDYLAYFIAVQHKYFQPNKLTDSLESFVVYIQGELYNASEDIDLCGRTIKDWKILEIAPVALKSIPKSDFVKSRA